MSPQVYTVRRLDTYPFAHGPAHTQIFDKRSTGCPIP